jgi:hypothetical protein
MAGARIGLEQYLQLRHRLGHDFADAPDCHPRYLDYLKQSRHTTITVAERDRRGAASAHAGPRSSVRARRVTAVRGFASHLAGPRLRYGPLEQFKEPNTG